MDNKLCVLALYGHIDETDSIWQHLWFMTYKQKLLQMNALFN